MKLNIKINISILHAAFALGGNKFALPPLLFYKMCNAIINDFIKTCVKTVV